MLGRNLFAPALVLASAMLSAQSSTPSTGLQAVTHPPELIGSQKTWTAQGPCKKKQFVWAYVRLSISEEGSPEGVEVDDFSDPNAKDLASDIVRADRFKPADRDGKPVAARGSILVEMKACVDKVKQPDGKKTEQASLDAPPTQTLYSSPSEPAGSQDLPRTGGHISAPVVLNQPVAEYTPEARKARVQGEVMISVIVDAQGMPQNARVVKPLPAGLSEAALDAVRKYRFKPALKDGKFPVPVMVTIAVNFRL